jgi:predicted ATPase with chaperone activity
VDVPRVIYAQLGGQHQGELSAAIDERVAAERLRHARLLTNGDMRSAEVRRHCQLGDAGQRLIQAVMRQLHLFA